ncbi:MAG: TatD family hydrolase [Spirochaetaceae bacterium]|jgi:TatD DNase family protein|nr:TatD family hydrolase [Spirochaetaceae bacterium]
MKDCFLQGLTDTHAHLMMLSEIDDEKAACLSELAESEFGFILDIGTDPPDLGMRIEKLKHLSNVRFAGGIWPHKEAVEAPLKKVAVLESQLNAAPRELLAAIGECGYDRRENPSAPAGETELLECQLELARRFKLPIIIHSRDAPHETIETLSRFPDVRGVIHCFSYGTDELKQFLSLDYFISFAGNLTYKNAANLREAVAIVPSERLLLETDCPFLAPTPFRGKTCRPEMIVETYKTAAALRNTNREELKIIVAENAKTLFPQAILS